MSNENDFEEGAYYLLEGAYHLLRLLKEGQLRPSRLKSAKAKAEEEVDNEYLSEYGKKKVKEYIDDAYILILRMITEKSKEIEFKELYDQEMSKRPEHKPPTPEPKPTKLLITNDFYADGFVLLKGKIPEVQQRFNRWLTSNDLPRQEFSCELIKSPANTLTLAMRGPAEGPHSEKLGVFFRDLIKDGSIAPRQNEITPTSTPALAPTPTPKPGSTSEARKKEKEEEERKEKERKEEKRKKLLKPK